MVSLPAIKKFIRRSKRCIINATQKSKNNVKWGEGWKNIGDGENCEGRYLHDFCKGYQAFECKGFVAED